MVGITFLSVFYRTMDNFTSSDEKRNFENFYNDCVSSKHVSIESKSDLEDGFIRYLLQLIFKLYGSGCIDKSKMLSIYTDQGSAFEKRDIVSFSDLNQDFNNSSLCENIIKNFMEIRKLYNNEPKNANELKKEIDLLTSKLVNWEKEFTENKFYKLSAALSSNKILTMVNKDLIKKNEMSEFKLKEIKEELKKIKDSDLSCREKLENANTLNNFLVKSKLELETKNLELEEKERLITQELNNFSNELKKEKFKTINLEEINKEKDLIIQNLKNITEKLSLKLKEFEVKIAFFLEKGVLTKETKTEENERLISIQNNCESKFICSICMKILSPEDVNAELNK